MSEYEKGDWVRFSRNGELYIAQVEYVREANWGKIELVTDEGIIQSGEVLERRGAEGFETPIPKGLDDEEREGDTEHRFSVRTDKERIDRIKRGVFLSDKYESMKEWLEAKADEEFPKEGVSE